MINSITISGFRGFGSDVVVSLPKPNGDLGSGLFMLVGPNNSGKTSFTECFRLFNYPYSQLPTLSSDKCNSKKDGFVEITIDVVNQGRFTLQSDRQGSFLLELLKDGVKYSSEAPFEPRVFVMQSRRYFEHYFGRNENDDKSANSRAQQFTSRSYRLEQFEQRLFKMHKEHELFNDLLTELYGERIEWSLVQNPSQQYQLQIGERTLARTTEGVGDGILSLFTVCDLLYDSNEGDTLIIDEPELSLHPALQKRVMDVLLKFSETRQIILSTHSPYFISIESLTNGGMIGRAHLIDGDIQIGVLTNKTGKKLYSVSQNLNNPHIFGLDAKEVFFLSDGVVLVEGQEDVVVLRRFEIELGKKVAGTLYGWGVGGAGNFSLFMQLLKELGFKKVTAILDGNMEATAQALSSKYPEYQVFTIVTDDIRDKSPRTISEKSGYATTDGKLKEQYRSDAQRLMEKIQAYQTSENFITELNDLEISVPLISDPSKTAVVVGCSSSAGREITQDLHMNGWKVAGVDRETPSYSLEHFFKVSRDCPEEISDIASRCCKELGSIDLLVNVSHHARGRSEEVWDDIVHAQNINFLPFCLSMHLESSLAKGSIVINVGATIQDQKDLLRQAYFDFLHFSLQTLTNTLAKKLSGVAQVYSIEHGSYSSCVSERGYTRKKLEAQAKESSDAAVVRIVRWLTEVPNHLATGLTIFLEDTHL